MQAQALQEYLAASPVVWSSPQTGKRGCAHTKRASTDVPQPKWHPVRRTRSDGSKHSCRQSSIPPAATLASIHLPSLQQWLHRLHPVHTTSFAYDIKDLHGTRIKVRPMLCLAVSYTLRCPRMHYAQRSVPLLVMQDKRLSDPVKPFLDLMHVGGIVRQAAKLVKGVQIQQSDSTLTVAVLSPLSWFKVRAESRQHLTPALCAASACCTVHVAFERLSVFHTSSVCVCVCVCVCVYTLAGGRAVSTGRQTSTMETS